MKVLMLNGSPSEHGCTRRALEEVARALEAEGVETEIFWPGRKTAGGCMDCGACGKLGKCVLDDGVNRFAELAAGADGFVFGSPVHYAAASGTVTGFLDRLFSSCSREVFRLKPGAAVVSARRAGTTAALDQLNKYFTISEMPVISSRYWNMVHGSTPEEVEQDLEGLHILSVLGKNMAYFLRCRQAAMEAGILPPPGERGPVTNFIR